MSSVVVLWAFAVGTTSDPCLLQCSPRATAGGKIRCPTANAQSTTTDDTYHSHSDLSSVMLSTSVVVLWVLAAGHTCSTATCTHTITANGHDQCYHGHMGIGHKPCSNTLPQDNVFCQHLFALFLETPPCGIKQYHMAYAHMAMVALVMAILHMHATTQLQCRKTPARGRLSRKSAQQVIHASCNALPVQLQVAKHVVLAANAQSTTTDDTYHSHSVKCCCQQKYCNMQTHNNCKWP